MNMRTRIVGVMLPLVLAASVRGAEIEPGTGSSAFLGTTPATPVAGQPFTIDIYNGPCESLYTGVGDLTAESFVGSVLTLNLRGLPDDSCSQTPATRHYPYPGLADAGTYRLRINMVITDFPGLQGEFLGGRDVVVVASPGSARAARVPALRRNGVIVAMAGMVVAAWLAMRRI